MDLADYRERAEAFTIALGGEHHRHFAGHAATLAIDPIQARFADLFGAAAIATLRERLDAATGEDARRGLRALLGFAVEGHLAAAMRALDAETARREAAARLDLDGARAIPFLGSQRIQADEPDAVRRAAIEAARLRVVGERLEPLRREALERTHACARALGWPSYRALCETVAGVDYSALSLCSARLLEQTAGALADRMAVALPWSAGGVVPAAAARSDLPRFHRAAPADRWYPAAGLRGALDRTLAGLGISLSRQANVHVDAEPRAGKSPRAFCAPVRVPDEIHLVVAPLGGRDDYVALLHEAGHAEHYAWTDPSLPFESRRLGEGSVTEAFAFLFDGLADDPRWLATCAGAGDLTPELEHFAAASRLLYVRRYCAKLAFELELHGSDPAAGATAARYAELLSRATGVAWPEQTWLTDLDPLLYCATYVRAWALAAQLRAMLTERFGGDWFDQPAAGDRLRSLWRDGQRLGAEQLAAHACDGAALDFGALLEELTGAGAAISG